MTWLLLLLGMFLKYVTKTTEVGVQVAGPIHGVVFIAYVLTAVTVGIDRRWPAGRIALAVGASIPPLATLPLERYAERHDWLAPSWRLLVEPPAGGAERVVAWLVRHPGRGATAALVAVAVLTVIALLVGPPVGG